MSDAIRRLRERFPNLSAEEIKAARAYGGSIIQDLGYYPFGSTLFTQPRALRAKQ